MTRDRADGVRSEVKEEPKAGDMSGGAHPAPNARAPKTPSCNALKVINV